MIKMKKLVAVAMAMVVTVASTFAGTYKGMTLDSEEGFCLSFNTVQIGECNGYWVDENLWGGYGMQLVNQAMERNKDFKNGLITDVRLINGTDLAVVTVEVDKKGKFVKAKIDIFGSYSRVEE